MTAKLSGNLRVYCTGTSSVLRMWAGCGDIFHYVWQTCQKMIRCNSTTPPLFSRLVCLVEVRVVANETVNLIRIEYTMVTFLAQDFVAAADAFQLRIL